MVGKRESFSCECGNTVFIRAYSVADCRECNRVWDPWDNAGRNTEE